MLTETRSHARLAPSSAKRWMTCPGSVRLCAEVVDAGSDDANKGTACHAVLERVLNSGGDAAEFVGKKIDVGEDGNRAEIDFTAEMAGWVMEVVAWVREYLRTHPGSHLRTEERLIIGRAFGCPDDFWGTADILIVNDDELVVCDAKFGYNEVGVIDNEQLQSYGIGAAADYGWVHERYRFVIAQPQCGEPKENVLTRDELLDVQRRYAPKVAATKDPNAPIVVSADGCKWCPAAGVCPEQQKRALEMAQREFVSVETLPIPQLAELLRHAARIKAGLDAAERHATRLAQLGQTIPGFKLAAGDKRRIWKDEAAARELMTSLGFKEDDIAPRKVVTPAQAEKLVGRKSAKALAPFIERPKGDAVLVPDDDPREALGSDFEPLDVHPPSTLLLPDGVASGVTDLL